MFTCRKREEIRFSIAWIVQHLIRADVAPNRAICDEHDKQADKYLHEVADHFGYVLLPKNKEYK